MAVTSTMDLVYWVSIVAQFFTYASFLSGAKLCHTIHQQKSSDFYSPMPFLAALCCSALWLRYGFLTDEWEIRVVNIIGIAFSTAYLTFFAAYTKRRLRLGKQLFSLLIILATLFYMIDNYKEPKFLCGLFAFMSSVTACLAPLATINDVYRTKCVSSLPFPIILSSFTVSFSWLTYGYLKQDNFIMVTNVIASFISGGQLLLFAIYPSTIPYEKLAQEEEKPTVSRATRRPKKVVK